MSGEKAGSMIGWLWKVGRWIVLTVIVVGIVYQMQFSPVTVQGDTPTRQTVVSEVMGRVTRERPRE